MDTKTEAIFYLSITTITVLALIIFALWYLKNLKLYGFEQINKKIKFANFFIFAIMYCVIYLAFFDFPDILDLVAWYVSFLWFHSTTILLFLMIIFSYLIFRFCYTDNKITPMKLFATLSTIIFIYCSVYFLRLLNFPEQNIVYKLSNPLYVTLIAVAIFVMPFLLKKTKR